MKHGFIKTAAVTPQIKTTDVKYNTRQIIDKIIACHALGVQVAAFPLLAVTGYALGDLVYQPQILKQAEDAIKQIADATAQRDIIVTVSVPIALHQLVILATAILYRGVLIGLVPMNNRLQLSKGYSVFASKQTEETMYAGFITPISNHLLVQDDTHDFTLGIANDSDFHQLTADGANIVVYPTCEKKLCSNQNWIPNQLEYGSKQNHIAILQVGASKNESAAHAVYQTDCYAAEDGEVTLLANSDGIHLFDFDLEMIRFRQRCAANQRELPTASDGLTSVAVQLKTDREPLDRVFDHQPFYPKDAQTCTRILDILTEALQHRIAYIDAETLVVGVSGGLDSLMAVLVCNHLCDQYDFPRENVICVTLPAATSSNRTVTNAEKLIACLRMTHQQIPIQTAVDQHLKDIAHQSREDTTYENAQARERTKILLNIANSTTGMMLGTSDMSELALGFCTFGGDHTAMYQVNAGIAKTTIRGIVSQICDTTADKQLQAVLTSILDTPVSPELLFNQQTEKILGNYELHDFFLYHFLKNGYSSEKLLFVAEEAFSDYDIADIKQALRVFLKRFFAAQYKRNSFSDSVQVFDVSLTGRNFELNSDISGDIFLR